MKLYFATTNKHKFAEVEKVLIPFGIELERLDREYLEPQDYSLEEIAAFGAKTLAEEIGEPVVTDDTGIFFNAYKNFPGPLAKSMFDSLGYEGLFKLLEGKDRSAYLKTAAAFFVPGEEPKIFEGICEGVIAEKVYDLDKDVLRYERIFIPEGSEVTHSKMTREEKNKNSHRAIAFRKLGEYLKSREET